MSHSVFPIEETCRALSTHIDMMPFLLSLSSHLFLFEEKKGNGKNFWVDPHVVVWFFVSCGRRQFEGRMKRSIDCILLAYISLWSFSCQHWRSESQFLNFLMLQTRLSASSYDNLTIFCFHMDQKDFWVHFDVRDITRTQFGYSHIVLAIFWVFELILDIESSSNKIFLKLLKDFSIFRNPQIHFSFHLTSIYLLKLNLASKFPNSFVITAVLSLRIFVSLWGF